MMVVQQGFQGVFDMVCIIVELVCKWLYDCLFGFFINDVFYKKVVEVLYVSLCGFCLVEDYVYEVLQFVVYIGFVGSVGDGLVFESSGKGFEICVVMVVDGLFGGQFGFWVFIIEVFIVEFGEDVGGLFDVFFGVVGVIVGILYGFFQDGKKFQEFLGVIFVGVIVLVVVIVEIVQYFIVEGDFIGQCFDVVGGVYLEQFEQVKFRLVVVFFCDENVMLEQCYFMLYGWVMKYFIYYLKLYCVLFFVYEGVGAVIVGAGGELGGCVIYLVDGLFGMYERRYSQECFYCFCCCYIGKCINLVFGDSKGSLLK